MSNQYDVVLTVPDGTSIFHKAVEPGLYDLGFTPVRVADHRGQLQAVVEVWYIDGRKLNYYEHGKFGIEGLRDLVLALPWNPRGVGLDLHVLWSDDNTTADDSWAGRTSPYAWNHETWEVRP